LVKNLRDNQITSESKIPNKHSTEYRHRHLRSDINDKAGDKSSNNRSENKREIIKRARSKSPPIQSKRHRVCMTKTLVRTCKFPLILRTIRVRKRNKARERQSLHLYQIHLGIIKTKAMPS
jgi:hypothetical protein